MLYAVPPEDAMHQRRPVFVLQRRLLMDGQQVLRCFQPMRRRHLILLPQPRREMDGQLLLCHKRELRRGEFCQLQKSYGMDG